MCLLINHKLESRSPAISATGLVKQNASGSSKYTDLRREKSKIAARSRREKESEILHDLVQLLPVSNTVRESLDQSSIVRLTLSDLKIQKMVGQLNNTGSAGSIVSEFESCTGNALGGFVIVLGTNGDIIYVSKNISNVLGMPKSEILGKSIYEFSHPCDHHDVKDLLFVGKVQDQVVPRSGLIRLKCTITSRGGCVNFRAASNKVIHFTGKLFLHEQHESSSSAVFIGVGEPVSYLSESDPDIEYPFKQQTFLTKHSPDMKCVHVDEIVESILGYKVSDMMGQSFFEFQHGGDGIALAKIFKTLYEKGQIRTEPYRFLAKNGGWVWIVTEATCIPVANSGSSAFSPKSIVCRHFAISEIQNREEILSIVQMCNKDPEIMDIELKPVLPQEEKSVSSILNDAVCKAQPILSTSTIFVPKIKNMDVGFLLPTDNNSCENDLTHLAPIAGDETVPLNFDLCDDLLQLLDTEVVAVENYVGNASISDIVDLLRSTLSVGNNINIVETSNTMPQSNTVLSPISAEIPSSMKCEAAAEQILDPYQEQLENNYFMYNDKDINTLMSLSQEFESNSLISNDEIPSPPSFDLSLIEGGSDANWMQTPFNDLEEFFLKRKADQDLPQVVTSSTFSGPTYPAKFSKLSIF